MPTETGADEGGDSSAALFGLLSDETRLAIVRELYRHDRSAKAPPGLSFSALCERLAADDTGRFNYHLGKLRGSLVEKRGDRYVLTTLGIRLGALVVEEPISVRPTEG